MSIRALWVVQDADTKIYMFGTVHILKPGMGWFDEEVKAAFDRSDRLVLELVEPDMATTQQLFGKYGIDQSGKPLTSKMTEEERAIYAKAMEKVGLPVAAFEPLDPWAAAVTMQVVGLQKSGFDVNSGVETQLTAAAKAANKPIIGVETMEQQLQIFDNLSQETQLRFLVEGAKSIDDLNGMMDNMVDLWGQPDPEGLAKLMNEGMTDPKLFCRAADQPQCPMGALDQQAVGKAGHQLHGGGCRASFGYHQRARTAESLWHRGQADRLLRPVEQHRRFVARSLAAAAALR